MNNQLTNTNRLTQTASLNGRQNEIAQRRERHEKHLARIAGDDQLTIAIQGKSPKQLFDDGLTITAGLTINRATTKLILLNELTKTWRAVRLPDSRSWQNQDDLQTAIDDVIDVFPTLKIEEFGHVMKMIRRGEITLFGRFDTPSMIGALRDYELKHTVVFRENQHHERAHREQQTMTNRLSDDDKQRFSDFVKQLNLPHRTKTLDELGGSIQMTESEMIEITKPFKDNDTEKK